MHDNQNNKNNLLRCMSCFGCRPITAARRAILQKKLPRYLQNGAFLLYICKKQPLTMQITLPDSNHLEQAAELIVEKVVNG